MVQLELAELIASGETRLADGTLIGCANYAGCASHSAFAGEAGDGDCPSKSRFYWGMRLVLICDGRASRSAITSSSPKTASASRPSASPRPTPTRRFSPTRRFWGAEYERTIELDRRRSSSPPRGIGSASGRPRRSQRLRSAW